MGLANRYWAKAACAASVVFLEEALVLAPIWDTGVAGDAALEENEGDWHRCGARNVVVVRHVNARHRTRRFAFVGVEQRSMFSSTA